MCVAAQLCLSSYFIYFFYLFNTRIRVLGFPVMYSITHQCVVPFIHNDGKKPVPKTLNLKTNGSNLYIMTTINNKNIYLAMK